MALYMLTVHMVEGEAPPPEDVMQQMYDDVATFNEKLQADGVWVFAGGLEPADIATVVDATGADVLTTDGPFAEAKEHIGGFWILDVADLDAALALAAEASRACQGKVEVRPFQADPKA